MSVTIKKVESGRDFKVFARFANKLYKGNKYYVPALVFDELGTFDKNKNGAYEFCDAEFYLAYKDGQLVGRVAAIIRQTNHGMSSRSVSAGLISSTIWRCQQHCSMLLLSSEERLA